MAPYSLYPRFSLFALFTILAHIAIASDITTYEDNKCSKSHANLDDVVNGYPDGVCTKLELSGSIETFQLAKLDRGCAVTLYGADETSLSCSSSVKIVGELATCYNSSWAYYSIDGCDPPSSSSIVLPTATPTPSYSSTALLVAPPLATQSESAASASASASPTPDPSPRPNHVGVIIGGIVGGVAVVALFLTLVLLCLRRRNRPYMKPLPPPPSYELSNDNALSEAAHASLRYEEKPIRMEMWGHDAAVEMGRNSAFEPPLERPGNAFLGDEKKGMDPFAGYHKPM